ncbi:MAG: UUP1 family membrane protein [Pseudomonadota bacterium]
MCLLAYRIVWLGYPIFPTAPGRTWQLLVDAHIKGGNGETIFSLALPCELTGRMLIEEKVTSGTLNFNLFQKGPNRIGTWSGSIGSKEEEINYRAIILFRPGRSSKTGPPTAEKIPPRIEKKEQALTERLTRNWRQLAPTARVMEVIEAVDGRWKQPTPKDQDIQAWSIIREKYGRVAAIQKLLEASGLPSRIVEGLRLTEGIETRPLTWIEVWTGQRWESMWPETGEIEDNPATLLPLATGGLPASHVSGGELSDIRWIINRQIVSHWRLHFERIQHSTHFLDRWSLFRLPLEFQQTFRILLLVPIGALIVGFLRNLVGFPTFGIFMPVLMALAFRNTGLIYGLGIFAGILFIGYAIRLFLDKLRLLLVPRMSVILTFVIACFTILALVGNTIGLRQLMAVGLLPFVILTMVIERFFVLIEEAGVAEGFRTAAGSAVVSIIAYLIISWEPLQITFFVFPELLAATAATQILLGRYTGYRLSEIFRFRALGGSP